MKSLSITLPAGKLKRVYVLQHCIKVNAFLGMDEPVFVVLCGRQEFMAHRVHFYGTTTLIYHRRRRNKYNAVAWIETREELTFREYKT